MTDRTARETGLAPIAAPVAHRKVDPKYIAAAVAEHVQGKVQLLCVIGKDGRVGAVELVRGIDDRLNASAMEALRKWEFEPATREGVAVAVDVLVEIPFRLNLTSHDVDTLNLTQCGKLSVTLKKHPCQNPGNPCRL